VIVIVVSIVGVASHFREFHHYETVSIRRAKRGGSPRASVTSERIFWSSFFKEWFPQRREAARGNPTQKKVVL